MKRTVDLDCLRVGLSSIPLAGHLLSQRDSRSGAEDLAPGRLLCSVSLLFFSWPEQWHCALQQGWLCRSALSDPHTYRSSDLLLPEVTIPPFLPLHVHQQGNSCPLPLLPGCLFLSSCALPEPHIHHNNDPQGC